MTCYLAVEGGGTRSIAGFYEDTQLVAEATAGPSNPLAYGAAATAGVITALAAQLVPDGTKDYTLLAGISGVTSEEIARDIMAPLGALPGLTRATISTDLHPLLLANVPDSPGILVIAGTGASVLVHDGAGCFHRFGGRGTVMGDEGSACQIAVAALRAVAQAADAVGPPTTLQTRLPAALDLPDVEALVPWSLSASKQALAALARTVTEAAEDGDSCARDCITTQAECLARLTLSAAATMPGDLSVPLFLQGGVVEHCTLFRECYLKSLSSARLVPEPLRVRGHEAVLSLHKLPGEASWCYHHTVSKEALSPTEGQSKEVVPIDQLDTVAFVDTMIRHEAKVAQALRHQADVLVRVTDAAGEALRAGGRIIYVGAGTSGRLGVLDASECPPTFGTDPAQVVGIMAGGDQALRDSVEGAEDDRAQGAADLKLLDPLGRDIVIGIAASGTTPYVLAALEFAQRQGCTTVLLCCNPQMSGAEVDHVITLPTGAEVLPGSTRLNAGTATKVALNIISTGAMAQSGYVYAGRMVKMNPSNTKLRARAVRMVGTLTGETESHSEALLQDADYEIPIALIMAKYGVDVQEARHRYEKGRGQLHEIL